MRWGTKLAEYSSSATALETGGEAGLQLPKLQGFEPGLCQRIGEWQWAIAEL
jgi:hypothetical protein